MPVYLYIMCYFSLFSTFLEFSLPLYNVIFVIREQISVIVEYYNYFKINNTFFSDYFIFKKLREHYLVTF